MRRTKLQAMAVMKGIGGKESCILSSSNNLSEENVWMEPRKGQEPDGIGLVQT